eukprot:scaffold13147_cov61-Phaeocystis_antarctica.AAC.2
MAVRGRASLRGESASTASGVAASAEDPEPAEVLARCGGSFTGRDLSVRVYSTTFLILKVQTKQAATRCGIVIVVVGGGGGVVVVLSCLSIIPCYLPMLRNFLR